jgi:hypothetical protein
MLEAGPDLNPAKDYKENVWPYELPHRGAGLGGKLRSDNEFMAPNARGRLKASRTGSAAGSRFRWFARASSADAPITGAAWPCGSLPWTSMPWHGR